MFRYAVQNLHRHFLVKVPVAFTSVNPVESMAQLFALGWSCLNGYSEITCCYVFKNFSLLTS
jgi:hypothetical protein